MNRYALRFQEIDRTKFMIVGGKGESWGTVEDQRDTGA